MLCPNCKLPLVIADRQSVEIDYCPECRGVWLDRGELDKILERSGTPERGRGDHRQEDAYGKKKKRESFLGELFDF